MIPNDKPIINPVHPGEMLLEEFLKPLGLSQYKLSKATGIPESRISQIIRGKCGVTAETALRLGRALGTTPEFWLGLQQGYDLVTVRKKKERQLAQVQALVA